MRGVVSGVACCRKDLADAFITQLCVRNGHSNVRAILLSTWDAPGISMPHLIQPSMPSRPDYTSLAAEIRKQRRRLKLTQAQFAEKIGVRQQQVSEWEQGKRLRLLSVAFRLARVLGRPSL